MQVESRRRGRGITASDLILHSSKMIKAISENDIIRKNNKEDTNNLYIFQSMMTPPPLPPHMLQASLNARWKLSTIGLAIYCKNVLVPDTMKAATGIPDCSTISKLILFIASSSSLILAI